MPTDANDARLTLGRFLADVASLHGERPAIHFEGQQTSYRDLERGARRLAKSLVEAGVVKGARVAIQMANRPEWIEAVFAVGMLGGVAVPVNTFASRVEFDFIMRHSDASFLLMQSSLLSHRFLDELLDDHPEIGTATFGGIRVPSLPQLRGAASIQLTESRGAVLAWTDLLAMGEEVRDELIDALVAEVEPSDDALIIYTSGTTSRPKGVLHSQRAAILQGRRFAELMLLEAEDRVFSTYPFFWTAGIAMSLIPALASGARLLLQETFEPGAALDLIEGERATAVHAWPHQQKALGEHASAAGRELGSVRKVDFSAPIAKLAGVERDEYGAGASYGSSETFTISSMLPCDAPLELRATTHGRPLPGMALRIVDPETGERLTAGSEGEIAVKGVTLMRGYYKVLPELYLDQEGFFRTQDGGSLDSDGYLHWSGRLSNLIKTGGANVSPLEIEAALEEHPAVKLSVAVGIGHPTLGEVIVLCVVPVSGTPGDEAALRSFLRKRLAAYKVPRRVLFFSSGELAYTGNQKVQVAPLREAAQRRLEQEEAEIEGYRYRAD
jgi:acyl-CoA synthetase (AMP-forming)/AMP-acid ligase II